MNKKNISILLGIACVILTFAITVQIRTISSKVSGLNPSYVNDELRDEVLKSKESYEEKYKELEKAQLTLEKNRTSAAENDTNSREKEEELKKSEAILGLTEVTGKGIEITINDSQTKNYTTIKPDEDISSFLVHIEDLQDIINELRNAGAEAISINDQRIVASSTLECVGNVTRINGERAGVPFKIKAIGNQEQLYGAIHRPGGPEDLYKNKLGLEFKLEKPATNLTIVKYSGTMKAKYMKEVK